MKTLLLTALLTLPLSADIITFASSAATGNNAYATTVDQGPSDIIGADWIGISPVFGSEVGFYALGNYSGTPVYGQVTVKGTPGSKVQFDGTWLTQDLGGGPQTFVFDESLLVANIGGYYFAEFIPPSGSAAFSGYIQTANAPEPGTWALMLCGVGLLVAGKRRRAIALRLLGWRDR